VVAAVPTDRATATLTATSQLLGGAVAGGAHHAVVASVAAAEWQRGRPPGVWVLPGDFAPRQVALPAQWRN
jgi:hypothetical protein